MAHPMKGDSYNDDKLVYMTRICGSISDITDDLSQLTGLPNSKFCSKYFGSCRDAHENYKAVRFEWKELDRCSVCHMDEAYEDNLFLQCDKYRMMVHAKCYGELEPLGGVLWFCNLCRPRAPKSPPPCCLCPVIGGAIKPTTDGRWAHLACAIWIPETCLLDIKKMEPIDGLRRINKDRWKLLCSICGVAYGACIQGHWTRKTEQVMGRVSYKPPSHDINAPDLCYSHKVLTRCFLEGLMLWEKYIEFGIPRKPSDSMNNI